MQKAIQPIRAVIDKTRGIVWLHCHIYYVL